MKKAFLVNYNHDPKDWWLDYGYNQENVTLFDRSDDGIERKFEAQTYRSSNIGDVDYDKLSYLVENYHNLPDVFLWSKSNIWKFISKDEWERLQGNTDFTPLLTQNHRTYSDQFGVVCRYAGNIYEERNNSWYLNAGLDNSGRFHSWEDWAMTMGLPSPAFIPFAPGGSYILTKERVHRYGRDHYDKMRSFLPYAQRPVEAHLCERSYYLMWK